MTLRLLRSFTRPDRFRRRTSLALAALFAILVAAADPTEVGSTPAAASAVRATKTTVSCKPDTLVAGASTACTAKVADTAAGKKSPPAGTVSFATNAPGSFDVDTCALAASAAAAATCVVAYRPDAIGNGTHAITASYAGSETHAASTVGFELAVTPRNDSRRSATALRTPPSSIEGTTVGATTDFSDPESACGDPEATVWYGLATRSNGRVAVRLRAHGKLDAVVAVFRRVRSQLKPLGCVPTDEKGIGGIAFQADRGGHYLIVVGERENSAASTFRLELFAPPLANPPGSRIPARGTHSSVDPLTRPEAAWSAVLAAGRTYRINLAPDRGRCLSLSVFRPGTTSFTRGQPIREAECGGYVAFTPGPDEGGRYSLLVSAYGNRGGQQRYRLQVARAGRDDSAPGLLIRNGQIRRGSLSGSSIDVLDLYRFDVTHRTEVTAGLHIARTADFDVALLSSEGATIACTCGHKRLHELRARLDEGTYFLAVRAQNPSRGPYRVSLLIREITSTVLLAERFSGTATDLGSAVELRAQVTPATAVGGLVRFRIDRFDPIEGWQFSRLLGARVGSGGLAAVAWTPPTVGRWRIRAFFVGTRSAAPSASAPMPLLVRG